MEGIETKDTFVADLKELGVRIGLGRRFCWV